MASKLTPAEKGAILAYHDADWTVSRIAIAMDRDGKTVRRVIDRWVIEDSIERKKGLGRPRKTGAHLDRAIVRTMKNNRFITAAGIREEYGLEEGPNRLCLNTIRSRIKETGLFASYWAAKKPFISSKSLGIT